MQKIVECVPNFSEGKDLAKIKKIFGAAKIPGVKVFELEYNASHNRCLFTIVGEPEKVMNAVYESIKTATKLIDMESHIGEHPRIGATDVVPFVPVSGVSMEECVELAKRLGKKVADELSIPVFLYEEAATKPENRNLADVRKGEYEGLRKEIETEIKRRPDFGPSRMHPTAGAIVIGARKYLVAYNVNLDTKDIEVAKQIASEDDEIDELYNQVFRELISFMVEDPRTITRATRLIWVAHNLERCADRVTNICERVIYIVTGKMAEINISKQ